MDNHNHCKSIKQAKLIGLLSYFLKRFTFLSWVYRTMPSGGWSLLALWNWGSFEKRLNAAHMIMQ